MSSNEDGVLLRGESAALSACRGPHAEAALQQILDDAQEKLLFGPVPVSAGWFSPPTEEEESGDNDVDEEDISVRNHDRVCVSGKVVIASKHLLFWCEQQEEEEDGGDGAPAAPSSSGAVAALSPSAFDLKVDALCIDLHALTGLDEDNSDEDDTTAPSAIYIQISTDASSNEDADDGYGEEGDASSLFELTLQPTPVLESTSNEKNHNEETERISRQLFDAISKMISLNPINPNNEDEPEQDYDDEAGGAFGAAGGSWITSNDLDPAASAMMAMMAATTRNAHDDRDDEMMSAAAAASNPPPASEEERNAMLERLDNLLIVPPEFTIHDGGNDGESERDGQFEDADEDDDIL